MLIDRDAALTAVDMDTSMVLPGGSKPGSVAWRMRDAALNALRALPVIGTCKDCAKAGWVGELMRCSRLYALLCHIEYPSSIFSTDPSLVSPDDYCSYHEARVGEAARAEPRDCGHCMNAKRPSTDPLCMPCVSSSAKPNFVRDTNKEAKPMLNERPLEMCCKCDEPTGKAGPGDGSIYCPVCSEGPFCEDCWDIHRDMEMETAGQTRDALHKATRDLAALTAERDALHRHLCEMTAAHNARTAERDMVWAMARRLIDSAICDTQAEQDGFRLVAISALDAFALKAGYEGYNMESVPNVKAELAALKARVEELEAGARAALDALRLADIYNCAELTALARMVVSPRLRLLGTEAHPDAD